MTLELPLLALNQAKSHHWHQVARKFIEHKPGTPERAVQDAIDLRFEGNNETFFVAVAKHLGRRPDSVGGAYYQALGKKRSLPEAHQKLYVELLDIAPTTVAKLGLPPSKRLPRDPLAALRAEVARLAKALSVARDEHQALAERVLVLERAGTGAARRPARAKNQGQTGP